MEDTYRRAGGWEWGAVADIDDDDLLTPVSALPSDDAGDDTDEVPDDGGCGDGQSIVRVWVQDGRLTKVRVSPNWHAKLGRRTLAGCFGQALAVANARVAESSPRKPRTIDEETLADLPRFSARSFAQFRAAFDDVEQRWGEALRRRAEQPPLRQPATTGTHKGVTVTLNAAGAAHSVAFDAKWLDAAQAGSICTHVMRAAENAYARFTPVEDDHAELDGIETEHEFLLTAFTAMLNPKERS